MQRSGRLRRHDGRLAAHQRKVQHRAEQRTEHPPAPPPPAVFAPAAELPDWALRSVDLANPLLALDNGL